MSHVRFTKADGRSTSVNSQHIYRLDETKDSNITTLVMTDCKLDVRGTMDEVEQRLSGAKMADGKTFLAEDSPVTPSPTAPGAATPFVSKEEIPQPPAREYKQPHDSTQMFSDENYDRPVNPV
jgi:uncharacterized protein YlzI (FlbEa/FlbD family)